MNEKRLKEVLDLLITWCFDCLGDDMQTRMDMAHAMELTEQEAVDLDILPYNDDLEDSDLK